MCNSNEFPKEINQNLGYAVDENGDVKPIEDYPDIEPSASPYTKSKQVEPVIIGPHMTLEEYYKNELRLIKIAGEISKLISFESAASTSQSIQNRYGDEQSSIMARASAKLKNIIHHILPEIYGADELIEAGFDGADIMFDAKTLFRIELMTRYGGKENTKKRALRREKVKAILKSLER
jgi:hypothetical protein